MSKFLKKVNFKKWIGMVKKQDEDTVNECKILIATANSITLS